MMALTSRERMLLRITLAYVQNNVDDLNDAFTPVSFPSEEAVEFGGVLYPSVGETEIVALMHTVEKIPVSDFQEGN
jgi:hypothetical protein